MIFGYTLLSIAHGDDEGGGDGMMRETGEFLHILGVTFLASFEMVWQ